MNYPVKKNFTILKRVYKKYKPLCYDLTIDKRIVPDQNNFTRLC